MTKKIAIIAEHKNGKVNPVTCELLTLAKKIQGSKSCDICFFIIGDEVKALAHTISTATGKKVHAIRIPGLLHYNGAIYKKALSTLFTKKAFDYILAPHSTSGMDYAPALSIALGGACITGVEDVIKKNGKTGFIRSMFGGKISARLATESWPLVLTLQPGSVKAFFPDKKHTGHVEKTVFNCNKDKMVFKGTKPSPSKGSDLGRARVIVSGGRGIKEARNYKLIEMLADLFPRSAAGGSRPICDYKWIPYSKQVGITGTIVSPKLYIACGISGAAQHVEAIRDAGFIIAINTDPDAPVFQVADVCIVEDLMEFIPLLIETIKKRGEKTDTPRHKCRADDGPG
ncbi:MAG: electron transfer flavoprotein subunit alpha/FixB family protein [Proteobacteria bacterium]|nr:electron transfer flavoprotein subunit alpha/FixB family protein [Pseudomonadota bacterium]